MKRLRYYRCVSNPCSGYHGLGARLLRVFVKFRGVSQRTAVERIATHGLHLRATLATARHVSPRHASATGQESRQCHRPPDDTTRHATQGTQRKKHDAKERAEIMQRTERNPAVENVMIFHGTNYRKSKETQRSCAPSTCNVELCIFMPRMGNEAAASAQRRLRGSRKPLGPRGVRTGSNERNPLKSEWIPSN